MTTTTVIISPRASSKVRTYGEITYLKSGNSLSGNSFVLKTDQPQICIKLKALFPRLSKAIVDEFHFTDSDENCFDLLWFIDRYPLATSADTLRKLKAGKKRYNQRIHHLETILTGEYTPAAVGLKNGFAARDYQLKAREIMLGARRMVLGDQLGLGKTLSYILCLSHLGTLRSLVVAQSHMLIQWKEEIEKFTHLKAHIITGFSKYKLPPADVYIINYHCLAKWISILVGLVRSVVFDECQELRVGYKDDGTSTEKYRAAYNLCERVKYAWGLSGSPIYNYGIEIFNILNCLKPDCLSTAREFKREWCGGEYRTAVKDGNALGAHLRQNFLFLRRTAKEVGRELPPINTIVQSVDYDEGEVEKSAELSRQLAISYLSATDFMIKGQLGRELDARARRDTGIAKAHQVAALVQILLSESEPVLLSGWHRDVYDIWMTDLMDYYPVMYTGSESPAGKDKAKKAFINGETNLMIISNRSGAGIDGLQYRVGGCRYVVIGELDWSPKVHEQIIGRVRRDGQQEQTTVIYPVCDYGSDPVITSVLALKSEQSHTIIDPFEAAASVHADHNRLKLLAESYLKKH